MKLAKILFILNTALFIISFSISFVILFRPFYYWQIKDLNLVEETGYTYQEIKEAYDDVINYTTLNKPFKTGKLKYSIEGKDHFKDCQKLFMINFLILGISLIIIVIKKIKFNDLKVFKRSIEFWSSILVLSTGLILLITSFIVGFDNCFETFHKIFFPGKDNWVFIASKDEIINILPIEYFMNCVILFLIISGFMTFTIIIKEIYNERKRV